MNVRIKSTATALLVAMAFLGTGSLLGTAPAAPAAPDTMIVHTSAGVEQVAIAPQTSIRGRSKGLQRHAAMPFFSFSRTLQ